MGRKIKIIELIFTYMPARVMRCILNCVFCGKDIARTKNRIGKGVEMYCSLKCSAKNRGYYKHLKEYNKNVSTTSRLIDGKMRCNICKELKLISELSSDKKRPLGVEARCMSCSRKRGLDYYNKNVVKIKKKKSEEESKLKRRLYYRGWSKEKREYDINYRIKKNLRCRVYKVLKNKNHKKLDKHIVLIGCTTQELIIHLKNSFTEGMSMDNYGKWEIDHIVPCSKFDLSKLGNQLRCFNYTNLQALWRMDNVKKSNK